MDGALVSVFVVSSKKKYKKNSYLSCNLLSTEIVGKLIFERNALKRMCVDYF